MEKSLHYNVRILLRCGFNSPQIQSGLKRGGIYTSKVSNLFETVCNQSINQLINQSNNPLFDNAS